MNDDNNPALVCLLLTATVQVRTDMVLTVRRDTNLRLEDYKQAFRSWINNAGVDAIVFVENSGCDLTPFQDLAQEFPQKQIEFLTFVCPPFDGAKGKGYGEMLCLKYCLENSQLLQVYPRFLKATGRYYLNNAHSFLQYLARKPEFDVVCNFHWNLTWADSRAFGGTVEFLRKYLVTMLDEVHDSADSKFEHVLARAVHHLIADKGKWSVTPEPLEVHGVSGSGGQSWTPGPLKRIRQRFKHKLLIWVLSR